MSPKNSVSFAVPQRAYSIDVDTMAESPKKSVHKAGSQLTNYFRPAHSEIRFGKMRFLITDRPTDINVEQYINDLVRHRATVLIRVCEPTYNTAPITAKGVSVQDWEFVDGQPPPATVIDKWLNLCLEKFSGNAGEECIAVHCVAGLGRAPVLVGIALLEAGMKCDDAVFLIRSQRRGALNERQLSFLQQYKSHGRLRKLRYVSDLKKEKGCVIM
ncbi:unnamed protein product [Bursaphelenchus okinawaensis]|uniref:Protein tyrosine phosphatase type IVA 3 n=1 Tax=Bursaphelenchus okinawaensis TaxID=465554 RepID=A0A811LQA4_9BILA|nr:unnamed protein product [Bursaphelenchus okinawaensis]CAG9127035.1 unnamed protein product [Bursaphelenchus okinawaensis]